MTSEKELIKIVKKHLSPNKKALHLTCKKAFLVAEEAGVNLKKVGQLCDKAKIKIRSCQLGCFK